MRFDVDAMPPEVASNIRARILRMLRASAFRSPRTWGRAVVVCTPERRIVLHRLAFAAELREAGLDEAAHEVAARRVGAGHVLAYLLVDNECLAGCTFTVVNLTGAAGR